MEEDHSHKDLAFCEENSSYETSCDSCKAGRDNYGVGPIEYTNTGFKYNDVLGFCYVCMSRYPEQARRYAIAKEINFESSDFDREKWQDLDGFCITIDGDEDNPFWVIGSENPQRNDQETFQKIPMKFKDFRSKMMEKRDQERKTMSTKETL